MPRKADTIADYFTSCLTVKKRADSNVIPTIAKGDCSILLQLVRMKLDSFQLMIDPSNPGRFRGTAVLMDDFKRVLGDVPRIHVPKWGASHVRGELRSDAKRGNKRHLIGMIELLNTYSGDKSDLQQSYDDCLRAHHAFWEGFSTVVTVQKTDPVQTRLLKLLSVPSLGRVQQGLVFSLVSHRYGKQFKVTTKKTFAGDEQSSRGELNNRGDVQIWDGEHLAFAIEVKDAIIDRTAWDRVAATHGEHNYPLLLLAVRYKPEAFQFEISSAQLTFAAHLADFVLSVLALVSIESRKMPEILLEEVIAIYNHEFCMGIENDPSIRITIVEK